VTKNVDGEGFKNDGWISFVEETLIDTKVDGERVGVNYGRFLLWRKH
jgi:hypothetical protein